MCEVGSLWKVSVVVDLKFIGVINVWLIVNKIVGELMLVIYDFKVVVIFQVLLVVQLGVVNVVLLGKIISGWGQIEDFIVLWFVMLEVKNK